LKNGIRQPILTLSSFLLLACFALCQIAMTSCSGGSDTEATAEQVSQLFDTDGDGITNDVDLCVDTPAGETPDADGCSASQDTDGDAVANNADICPDTPSGETVDVDGCSASERDADGDGVADAIDLCADTPTGETPDADGCSASQDTTPVVPVASVLSLSLSQTSVQSDNSDTATVTATVLDTSNAVLPGRSVSFKANGGQLSSATGETDANGQSSVDFSSGTADRSNQVATVSATVAGLSPVQIPIQITGSTLTLSTDNTALTDDGLKTASLTIAAKDAGGIGVANAEIKFDVSGGGHATVTPEKGVTDVNGESIATIVGDGTGEVSVKVMVLGLTATQDYTVSPVGQAFGITSPINDTVTLDVGNPLTVTVYAHEAGHIQFATTLGAWNGTDHSIITIPTGGGEEVSAALSSDIAGLATVQVYYQGAASASDGLTVAISSPPEDAAKMILRANPTVVGLSIGSTVNTATLIATVRTAEDQVVGGATVGFSIENPTGGGETISPAVGITDSLGIATTIFTSGSVSSSADGVKINAWVIDEGTTGAIARDAVTFTNSTPATVVRSDGGSFKADGFDVWEQIQVRGSHKYDGLYTIGAVSETTLTLIDGDSLDEDEDRDEGAIVTITAVADSQNIVIGGTAGSVVIGHGRPVTEINSATYETPMSVLVTDPNGNPVADAVVTLSAWPVQYSAGVWYDEDPGTGESYLPYRSGTFDNEDGDEDTVLDPGEDKDGNDEITPPNSAAGGLPATVITDDNGLANFELTYLKESAFWITTRVRANTLVLGTETTSSTTFELPYIPADGNAHRLPDSPYTVTVRASAGIMNSSLHVFPDFGDSITENRYSTSHTFTDATDGVYSYDGADPDAFAAGVTTTDHITIEADKVTVVDTGETTETVVETISARVPVRLIIE